MSSDDRIDHGNELFRVPATNDLMPLIKELAVANKGHRAGGRRGRYDQLQRSRFAFRRLC
jgi:hypothetical protein